MKYFLKILLGLCCMPFFLQAQPGVENERKWTLNGYIKQMQTVNMIDGFDSLLVDNLIHNRLNFRWFPESDWEFRMDLRNRVFYGDLVQLIPNYGAFIDNNNDYFDLSALPLNRSKVVFHTMIDRAYLKWSHNKWEATVGRQRINWGINTAWNPNDIFNAYSFFDFDYEERPGSDAVRVVYYTGFASSLEIAANMADDIDNWVGAGRWKFNQWNYDFQLIGGLSRGDLVLGAGWAGNLGQAGFKGEMSYFTPFREEDIQENVLVASTAFDYSFENSIYLYGSYLFNSGGENNPSTEILGLATLSNQRLNAKNLIPYRHTFFLQGMYPFHPLVNGGLALMYFPGDGAVFLNPTVTYSIGENWDLDLLGQLFYLDNKGGGNSNGKLFYLRLKWSF